MKLHLPTRLRAAVLACITAVAALSTTIGTGVVTVGSVTYVMAAAQAQAADATINTNNATINTYTAEDTLTFDLNGTNGGSSYIQMANITIAAHVVIDNLILNNGSSNKTYTFTNDFSGSGQFSFSGVPSNQVYVFSGDMSNYSGNMIMSDHVTMTFNGNTSGTGVITTTTKAATGAVPTLEDAETGAVTTNMKLNVNGATMLNSAITAGTLTVSGASSFAGIVSVNNATINSSSALTLSNSAALNVAGTLTLNLNGMSSSASPLVTVGGATLQYGSLALADYTMLDSGEYSLVSTTAEQAAAMATALNMTEGRCIVSADGGTLKLTVASGPAPITDTQNIAYNANTRTNGYEVQSGGNLRINNGSGGQGGAAAGAVSNIGPVTVQEGGTLTVWACQFSQKNLNTDNKVNIANNITIEDGGKVFIQDGSYNFTGTIAVSGNALFESQYAKGYTFSALSGGSDATLTIQQNNQDANTATLVNLLNANTAFEGTLNMKNAHGAGNPVSLNVVLSNADSLGKAKVVFDDSSTAANNLVLNTAAANVGSLSGAGNIITSSELAGGGVTAGSVTEGTLTITGTPAEGAAAFSGTVSGGVSLAVGTGATLDLGSVTLGHTIANSGTVNITDGSTITLSTLTGWAGDSSLSEGDNGFMTISKLFVVQGGTINASNVSVVAGSDTKTLAEDGSIAFSGDTDYSVYYLNSGSKALADITTAAGESLQKVVLKNNAMLTGITSSEGLSGDIGFEHETEFVKDGSIPTNITANATYGNLTGTGNIDINNAATLTVTGVNSGNVNINLHSADSKVVFTKGDSTSPVTMTMGNITAANSPNDFGREVVVENGVTLNIAALTNSWGMKGITVDGVLNVAGELKYSTGNNSSGNVIGGSGSVTAGSLTIANASASNTISVNSLTVTGNASISRATKVTGGTTTIQGNTTVGAALTIDGGTLVLGNEATDTAALNANVTLTNGGLTLKGDTTIGNSAAIAVNGGTLQIDGNLNTSGTLANGGNVVLNGTITTTSSALEAIGETGYTDELAPASGNGYLNGSFYVVKGGEGATSSLGADADVILDGSAAGHASLSATDGHVTLSVSSDTYYVNSDTVVYGAADNSAASAKTTGISLNGGNLTLSQALNEGVTINAAAAGTLTIGEGVTLAATDITRNATVTLAGAGTYAATAATDFSNLAYSGDWAGVVSLDPGAGETVSLSTYPASGTLSILSGTVDHNHGNVATLNCGLNIAAGATYQDYGNYKWALNLVGDLAGEGTMLSKTPTTVGQGDGARQVNLNGKTADFTGEWQLENAYSDNANGNRRVSGRLNSADSVFGGVVSFVAVTDGQNAPSADKTVAELRLMKSMTIGGVKGELGTIVAESSGTELIIDVAEGKNLTYSGTLDMANISSLTVTGEGTQTFSGITSTGAGAIVVGSDGAPVFAGANTISTLTIESGATLENSGSIAITGALNLAETLATDSTITLAEGGAIVVEDTTNFTKVNPTKRVDANGTEQAVNGNGFDADGGITLVSGTAASGVNGSATIGGISYDVVNGAVSLATYANYFVTSTDATVTSATAAAYATEKGGALTGITVSGGAEFTVDSAVDTVRTENGGAGLTVTDEATIATIELGADTTIANSGALTAVSVSGGTSSITGEGTVGTVTVTGGSVETEGNTGALTVEGGSATIGGNSGAVTATGGSTTVQGNIGGNVSLNGEGTTLSIGGNVSGSITPDKGTVKFLASETPHSVGLIDLSHGDTALGHVEIKSGAAVEQTGDLWMCAKNVGVLLEEGGSLKTKQGGVTITGLADGGSVTISEGQNYYQTGADKFVFTNVAVSTANAGATSLATHLSGAAVENLGAGMLTVISDGEGSITSVAATNGNVTVNGRTAETEIAIDSVTLAAGKSLTLSGDAVIGALNVDLATYVTEVPTEALTLISTAAGKTLSFETLDTSAKSVTIGEKNYVAQLTLNDNALTLAYSEANDLYWNGGNGNFSDAAWSLEGGAEAGDVPFIPGMGVTFDGTGGTITVDSAVSVGNMLVTGNYNFSNAQNLTITGTLTVDCPEDKKTDGVTATISALPTVDAIVVKADATLGLAAAQLRNATETLLSKTTGEGTVQLNSGTGFGNDNNRVSISDRTVTAATKLDITNDIAINGWKSNEQTGVTGSLVLTKDTTVGGEIRMETGAKLVIGEGASLTADKLSLGHASESAMAVGHLEMTGGTLNVGSIGLNNNQANTIDITGGTITITDEFAFEGAGTGTTVSIANATLATDGEHSWKLSHSATLTDVTVAAAEGTFIGLASNSDQTITVNGTLTNAGPGDMQISTHLTVETLVNNGTIGCYWYDLTLTEATEQGGSVLGVGTLTLAAGANAFTTVAGSTLDLTTAGATLAVSDEFSVETVKLGAFSNALTAATLGGDIAFNADAVELNKGTHTVATLTGESANFGSSTLVIGEQTITIGSDPVELTGTGQLISLVTSTDGKTLSVVVAYNGSEWTEEVDPGTQEAQWTQDMVTADSMNFSGKGSGTVTVAEDITVGTIVVDSDTEAKDYTFAGDNSVTADKLDMSTGSSTLTVATDMVVNNDATIGGSTADDTATLTVAEGGSLTAGSVTVNTEEGLQVDGTADIDALTVGADNALAIGTTGAATIGTLSAADEQTIDITNDGALTVTNGTIDSLTGSGSLTVADGGAVTVTDDLEMTGDLTANGALTIEGDLDAAALSGTGSVSATGDITADSISGVSVSADTLSATQVGNTVKDLTINTLEVTTVEGIGANTVTETGRDSYMEVSGTVGTLDTGLSTITIVLTDDAKSAVMTEMETATARDYLIIDGTTAVNKFVFDATQKQEFLKEGYKTSLVQGSVHLSVTGLSAAEKSWTVGSAKTAGGLDITTTGADAYAELASDGVENVHVANNGTINLTGAPTEVTLKNLSSAAGTTLTVTGDAGDTATLLATDAAGDYASKAHAGSLKADTVNVSVDGGETKLGAVELTNGAALTTTQGSSLSVGKLNAATPAAGSIAGDITVTGQGGSYKGAYAAPTAVTLAAGAKQTLASDANLSLKGAGEATLGGNNGVATLKGLDMNGGTLNLGTNTLTVQDADSAFKNGTISATISTDDVPLTLVNATNLDLSGSTLKLALTGSPDALLAQGAEVTLADLGATTNTTGMSVALTGLTMGKYFTDAVVNGGLVQATRNTSFYSDLLEATDNAATGAALLDDALVALDPQHSNPTGALAAVMDALDSPVVSAAEKQNLCAAVSGASIAAMGSALSGDVERQLRAIRNRTTTMGVNQGVVNEDMPYFNAWVNAEGDYRKVAADGTLAGYKMTSWGGTVGADVDLSPRFTCGLAATAMYGDFDADGTDSGSGDIDTYYVSAFARYAKHRWTHTFVATVGLAETSLERTVMGTKVKGDSDGMMFGGMYEVGYVFALDKDATTCLQPVLNVSYTHATLNGYTESGSELALTAGDTEFNKITVGAGARLQSIVGENIYNRSSILEARALVKFDAGDRQGETDVAFAGVGMGSHTTKSSETGAIGAEIGVGLTVPVGSEGGNIFMDASAEIRAEYTNVNATVGYRVNF